ncbi:E3 ubiquitin-protein ligase rnf13 [Mortierella sp. AD094]|nr:E3 ubiquitin-protein ligase rnf13 [Mortierella sp. AD094]
MAFRGASFLLFVNWLCIVIWLSSSFESTDATIIVLATNDTYIDRTAAFGPRIPEEGLLLNLIAIETLDPLEETTACRPVEGAPKNVSWVALVERGGRCNFVDKVRNMQASGAQAVIVGDNQRNPLITMYAREDTSDILIPSVFVTQNHYRELRYFSMELGKDFLVQMNPDEIDWPVLDVIIFIILSPAIVVLFLFFIWKLRMRQQRLADLAPAEVVNNLPVKVFFKSKVKGNEPVECVICLEDYVDEDELRVLPCRHEYHVACIDNWLTNRKKFCPICKRDICAATETTPLLGSSSRSPILEHGNNNGATSSTSSSSSASSSSTNSSTAGTSNGSGEVAILVDTDDTITSAESSSSSQTSTANSNPSSSNAASEAHMPPATNTESTRGQAQGLSIKYNGDRTSYVLRSMSMSPKPTYPNSPIAPNTPSITNYSSSSTSFVASSTTVSSLDQNIAKICGAVLGSMIALSLLCCICVFRRRLLNKQLVHSIQVQKYLHAESLGGTDMERYETLDKARIVVAGDIGTESKKKACFREDELPKRTSMRVGDKDPTSSVAPSSALWLFIKSTTIFRATDGFKEHDVIPNLAETSTRFDSSHYPGAAPGYSTFKSMPICAPTRSLASTLSKSLSPPTLQQTHSASDDISNSRTKSVKSIKDVVNESSNRKHNSVGASVKEIWERTGGSILKGRSEQRSKNHVSQYFKA